MSLPDTCTQCGSAYKVCLHCGEKIIFVPKSGFGNSGEWRHIEPYSNNRRDSHQAHPALHIT